MTGFRDIHITPEQIIRQEIVDARLKNNLNVLILISGPTGSGKSYSAIYIANLITQLYGTTKPFCVDDIVFTTLDFIKRFKELSAQSDRGIGSCLVVDESGVMINSRSSMSVNNVTITEIFEMLRFTQINVLFCVPAVEMTDLQIRRLNHYIMMAQPINRKTCPNWQKNLSTVRVYRVMHGNTPGEKEQNFKTACPVVPVKVVNSCGEHFIKDVRCPQMWLPRADEKILLEYEEKKRSYVMSCINRAEKKLEVSERKMQDKLGIIPEPQPPETFATPYITSTKQHSDQLQTISNSDIKGASGLLRRLTRGANP